MASVNGTAPAVQKALLYHFCRLQMPAVALSRVLKSFLFQVEPNDPMTLIGAAVLFTCVALLACWEPTRRAAKVDPIEALRYE